MDCTRRGQLDKNLLLRQAVERGVPEEAERLLKDGATPEEVDSKGNTLLHTAAALGRAKLCELLLDFGAKVDVVNCSGFSPLHLASRTNPQTVRVLIRAAGSSSTCADVMNLGNDVMDCGNDVSRCDEAPMRIASSSGLADDVMNRGNHVIPRGDETPLHIPSSSEDDVTNHRSHVITRGDETPLHIASSSGLADVIAELVASGSDVNCTTARGLSPLFLAVGSGSREAVKLLLDSGADVNQIVGPIIRERREEIEPGCWGGGLPFKRLEEDCLAPAEVVLAEAEEKSHVRQRVPESKACQQRYQQHQTRLRHQQQQRHRCCRQQHVHHQLWNGARHSKGEDCGHHLTIECQESTEQREQPTQSGFQQVHHHHPHPYPQHHLQHHHHPGKHQPHVDQACLSDLDLFSTCPQLYSDLELHPSCPQQRSDLDLFPSGHQKRSDLDLFRSGPKKRSDLDLFPSGPEKRSDIDLFTSGPQKYSDLDLFPSRHQQHSNLDLHPPNSNSQLCPATREVSCSQEVPRELDSPQSTTPRYKPGSHQEHGEGRLLSVFPRFPDRPGRPHCCEFSVRAVDSGNVHNGSTDATDSNCRLRPSLPPGMASSHLYLPCSLSLSTPLSLCCPHSLCSSPHSRSSSSSPLRTKAPASAAHGVPMNSSEGTDSYSSGLEEQASASSGAQGCEIFNASAEKSMFSCAADITFPFSARKSACGPDPGYAFLAKLRKKHVTFSTATLSSSDPEASSRKRLVGDREHHYGTAEKPPFHSLKAREPKSRTLSPASESRLPQLKIEKGVTRSEDYFEAYAYPEPLSDNRQNHGDSILEASAQTTKENIDSFHCVSHGDSVLEYSLQNTKEGLDSYQFVTHGDSVLENSTQYPKDQVSDKSELAQKGSFQYELQKCSIQDELQSVFEYLEKSDLDFDDTETLCSESECEDQSEGSEYSTHLGNFPNQFDENSLALPNKKFNAKSCSEIHRAEGNALSMSVPTRTPKLETIHEMDAGSEEQSPLKKIIAEICKFTEEAEKGSQNESKNTVEDASKIKENLCSTSKTAENSEKQTDQIAASSSEPTDQQSSSKSPQLKSSLKPSHPSEIKYDGVSRPAVHVASTYAEETKRRLNRPGITPLHRACQLGMESVARLLLQHGANVNAMTESGETPLYYAAKYSSTIGRGEVTGLLRLLLTSGARIGLRTSSGETALHAAALVGDALTVSILLSADANVNVRDSRGCSPLHKACQRVIAPEANRVRTVRLLLTHGADVTAVNDERLTPLEVALLQRDRNLDPDIVRLLLTHGADPNKVIEDKDQTPLTFTLEERLFECAKALAENGADPNAQGEDERTPMHLVCQAGHRQLFKFLWAKGGDPAVLDKRGFSPLRYAVESGSVPLVAACISTGAASRHQHSTSFPNFFSFPFSPDSYPSVSEGSAYAFLISSPFLLAFCRSQPAILHALFSSGGFSFTELRVLQKLSECLLPDSLSDSQAKCRKYVLDVSRQPPSLQLFCGWTISRLIGCSSDRKCRGRELGLPILLREFVMFASEG